ncbi:ABC transporter ATP-binding protein [Pontibacter locisalis]|uniref:ABC transporter ATP-binding protein n=1 Tax=Pontibacter locisalis TaxID=1719035 RepID=A0ABW5IKA8_9BACT
MITLLMLFLCAGNVKAQEESWEEVEPDTVIDAAHDLILKLQPLLIGEVRLSYEKLRVAKVSNEYGIGYVYRAFLKEDGSYTALDGKRVNGVSIRMSQRHYTTKKQKAPFGFFHGPLFGYRFLVFEKDALGVTDASRSIGRLYQNSMDLSYQLGWQLLLDDHFTMEVAGSLGGRAKYARATGAEELLVDNIYGHHLMQDRDAIFSVVPLPQLKLSVGYSF